MGGSCRVVVLMVAVGMIGCGRLEFASLIDGDLNADSDGDGIEDIADNCPFVTNIDQANEDGDAFGDVCDPCPPFADGDVVADPDGDGISGLCDPRPSLAGDRLVVFAGFNTPPGDALFVGNWTFANGQAIGQTVLGEVSTLSWPSPGGTETLMTHGVIDVITGVSIARGFGLSLQTDGPNEGVCCVMAIDGGDSHQLLIAENDTLGVIDSTAYDTMVGSTAIMTATRTGTNYTCSNGQPTPTTMGTTTHAAANPHLGVHVRSMSGRFDWAMIVQSP